MKKTILSLFFATVILLSMVFVSETISSQNPFSAQGQTARVKKKKVGAIRRIYRGGKYVGIQVWNGTRWVGKKAWKGTKYVGKKTWKGTKWTGRKVKKIY